MRFVMKINVDFRNVESTTYYLIPVFQHVASDSCPFPLAFLQNSCYSVWKEYCHFSIYERSYNETTISL